LTSYKGRVCFETRGVAVRVVVDETKCQGHTICNMVAGEVFKLRDEDGHAYVEDEHVLNGLEELVLKAEAGCPEQAIIVLRDQSEPGAAARSATAR
jgi:ferredoxin